MEADEATEMAVLVKNIGRWKKFTKLIILNRHESLLKTLSEKINIL
jgi:hypothetical protein